MFRTQDADMIGIPGMFGEGISQWHTVSRLLKTHWYHLTVRAEENGRSTELAFMIDGEQKLQHMLVAQGSRFSITDVQVVTPSYMSAKGKWSMEPLLRATIGMDSEGCEACLVEVEGGAVYHNSHSPDFRPDLLTNLRPIFQLSMIKTA